MENLIKTKIEKTKKSFRKNLKKDWFFVLISFLVTRGIILIVAILAINLLTINPEFEN